MYTFSVFWSTEPNTIGEQSRRALHGLIARRRAELVSDVVPQEFQQHRDPHAEEQVFLRELQRTAGGCQSNRVVSRADFLRACLDSSTNCSTSLLSTSSARRRACVGAVNSPFYLNLRPALHVLCKNKCGWGDDGEGRGVLRLCSRTPYPHPPRPPLANIINATNITTNTNPPPSPTS